MVDEHNKTSTFGGLAKRGTTGDMSAFSKQTMKVVKQAQKPGRKVDFEGIETTRMTVKLPKTTFDAMRHALIGSPYPTQNQFINAAILFFLAQAETEAQGK